MLNQQILQLLGQTWPKTAYIIVEGHIIFNYTGYSFQFDHKFFFTLNKHVCFERRQRRTYIPPDPEGYFDEVVWPYYLSNKDKMIKIHDDIGK